MKLTWSPDLPSKQLQRPDPKLHLIHLINFRLSTQLTYRCLELASEVKLILLLIFWHGLLSKSTLHHPATISHTTAISHATATVAHLTVHFYLY
jgi:hypothetical protein